MDETALSIKGNNPMTAPISLVKQRVSSEVWAGRIHECRSSGLTVTEYCRSNCISLKAFYYHLRKLREQECSPPEEQTPVRICELTSTVKPISVTVRDDSGITIEIADGTSAETIRSIILALKC